MVDTERLHRILRRISDDVTRLERYAQRDRAALLTDEAALGHVKYLFITAIEGCIDGAQHVCASEGIGPPDSNADAVRFLGRRGLLSPELADDLGRAVAFRNLLVHGYADIDDTRVVAMLDRLPDLRDYVAALAELLR